MKNLYEYLGIFENIVQKEVLNEVSPTGFNALIKPGTNSIGEFVDTEKNNFKNLENLPFSDIINKFKIISKGESLKTFYIFFKQIKIEIEKIIDNKQIININNIPINEFEKLILDELVIKYSSIKSSGKEGQTLSIPNAALEIKNIIQNKILEINNIPIESRPTKDEIGSFNDSTKKFTEEFLKRLSGDLEKLDKQIKTFSLNSNGNLTHEKIKYDLLKSTYDLLKSLYKSIPSMDGFHEACQKLSFAITLRIRLNQIYEDGKDYTKYFENMFEPNEKIKLTATKLSKPEMNEAVNSYINFIKRNDENKINNNDENNNKKRIVKALQFTLPAFKSKTGGKICDGAGACAAYCYAAAGTYQYPLGTFKSEFSLMFSLSKEFVPKLIEYFKEKLKKNIFYIFRIHDSGDFYSPKYFKKWIMIAEKFPDSIFYGYTKQIAYLSTDVPSNFKFTQSWGGRNDRILEKLLKIKFKLGNKETYSDREKKIIIRYLNLKSEGKRKLTLNDWDDENFKKILSKMNISKVFHGTPEKSADYDAERKANPGITWIKVVNDDIAALDVGLDSNSPIGIALFVHGQNSGKLKSRSK
jgi:hypothetical protein